MAKYVDVALNLLFYLMHHRHNSGEFFKCFTCWCLFVELEAFIIY